MFLCGQDLINSAKRNSALNSSKGSVAFSQVCRDPSHHSSSLRMEGIQEKSARSTQRIAVEREGNIRAAAQLPCR